MGDRGGRCIWKAAATQRGALPPASCTGPPWTRQDVGIRGVAHGPQDRQTALSLLSLHDTYELVTSPPQNPLPCLLPYCLFCTHPPILCRVPGLGTWHRGSGGTPGVSHPGDLRALGSRCIHEVRVQFKVGVGQEKKHRAPGRKGGWEPGCPGVGLARVSPGPYRDRDVVLTLCDKCWYLLIVSTGATGSEQSSSSSRRPALAIAQPVGARGHGCLPTRLLLPSLLPS